MKQRLQCSHFFCCNYSSNGKFIYPTLKRKLNAKKKSKKKNEKEKKAPNSDGQCDQEPVGMKKLYTTQATVTNSGENRNSCKHEPVYILI